jgi:hypothetical protein
MFLTWHNDSEMSSRVLKTRTLLARLAGAILLVCSTASLAFGTDSAGIYSGSSVDSSGKVSAWGVTNVAAMQHTAYVTTTLTSPNGRTVSADGTWIGIGHSRADLYLSYAQNDLGTYTTTSIHSAYCVVMGWFILNRLTQSSTTVPYVVLSLRNSGTVSADNSRRGDYNFELGTYNLGTFFSTGQGIRLFRTGVEIVGTVYPTSYAASIIFRRLIVQSRAYHDTVELTELRKDNEMDPYDPGIQDQDPQSGGSGGKVYDLDAPGIGTADNDPIGYIIRKRANYREWAELPNGTKVSVDLNWFSRLSVIRTGQTTEALRTDITGDNIAAAGSTPTTWNLQ